MYLIDKIVNIFCVILNRLWVSDLLKIIEFDEIGYVFRKLDIGYRRGCSFVVIINGDFFFLRDGNVYILILSGNFLNSCIYVF